MTNGTPTNNAHPYRLATDVASQAAAAASDTVITMDTSALPKALRGISRLINPDRSPVGAIAEALPARAGTRQSSANNKSLSTGTKNNNTNHDGQPSDRSRPNVNTIPTHRNGNETASRVRK